MIKFKLCNVLLKVQDHIVSFPELLYRAETSVDFSEDEESLAFEGLIDFLTYFNAISCEKWKSYTSIDNINLHLELAGDACEVEMVGVTFDAVSESDAPSISTPNTSSAVKTQVDSLKVGESVSFAGSAVYEALDIQLPLKGLLLGGFRLNSSGATAVRNAYWFTNVSEEKIRPVRLALSTTTFRKEDYVIPNINDIKKEILACDDPIADAFHMFVIDNGRTLDYEDLSDDGVSVLPNPNTGGSGGFARGMIEALTNKDDFTHVLLMDDDVRVAPESFKRTFNLLSLVNDDYKDAFINGAMIEIDYPNRQFEDVSHVRTDGVYARLKGNLFLDELSDIAVNERVNVEVPDAYGAWWYSCIPVSKIKECGLPLPLFIRCDDVEYGLRCQPLYMTMNGICVWHEGFGSKFRAPVDTYQYVRNYLIMTALHEKSNELLFLARTGRTLRLFLRAMAYETADLLVSGFEDYIKGPEFLMNSNGEEITKENGTKAEKLIPLEEALKKAVHEHPELKEPLEGFKPNLELIREGKRACRPLGLWRTVPYDRHMLPDSMLNNKPATIYHGGYTAFDPNQMDTRVYVACERDGKTAHVRFIDRNKCSAIKNRWKKARRYYAKHRDEIRKAYKDALPEMTSVEFWSDYLGLDK